MNYTLYIYIYIHIYIYIYIHIYIYWPIVARSAGPKRLWVMKDSWTGTNTISETTKDSETATRDPWIVLCAHSFQPRTLGSDSGLSNGRPKENSSWQLCSNTVNGSIFMCWPMLAPNFRSHHVVSDMIWQHPILRSLSVGAALCCTSQSNGRFP